MKLLFATLLTAHAGVFKSLCEKCLNALVADDTHQFNEVSLEWLIKATEALVIKARWQRLNTFESRLLEIQLKELRLRSTLRSDQERDLADEALIRFMQ